MLGFPGDGRGGNGKMSMKAAGDLGRGLLVLVPLGYKVEGALPVAVGCVRAELLHCKALPHGPSAKGGVVELHHDCSRQNRAPE